MKYDEGGWFSWVVVRSTAWGRLRGFFSLPFRSANTKARSFGWLFPLSGILGFSAPIGEAKNHGNESLKNRKELRHVDGARVQGGGVEAARGFPKSFLYPFSLSYPIPIP